MLGRTEPDWAGNHAPTTRPNYHSRGGVFITAWFIHRKVPVKRRELIRAGLAMAGSVILPRSATGTVPRRVSLVIRGGQVFDGLGNPGRIADIAIEGNRIAAIAADLASVGSLEIDARGLAVAPGFIDPHSHTDDELLINPLAESKVRQGVTSEICGQDGSSKGLWNGDGSGSNGSVREFLASVAENGASVNLGSSIGAGTIRGTVVGLDDRPATERELSAMARAVAEARVGGALGMSSGLEYIPGTFANTDELIRMATEFRGSGLPYATHMRNEDDELLGAIEEALHVGREAGIAVHISHLKAQGQGNWWKAQVALDTLQAAANAGQRVSFDRYPYVAYSTGLASIFPTWARNGGTEAFLARLAHGHDGIRGAVLGKIRKLGSWDAIQITSTASTDLRWAEGRRLGTLAADRNIDPYDLAVQLVLEDENRTGIVGFGMSEENTELMLSHPLGMLCSDGSALATYGELGQGTPHPRSYGSFARLLGHYVRGKKAMSLETAIKKMTSMPARLFMLHGRGRLERGAFADLVVFDPDLVSDMATFSDPHQYAIGIQHVCVNGTLVVRSGEHTGATPGKLLLAGR